VRTPERNHGLRIVVSDLLRRPGSQRDEERQAFFDDVAITGSAVGPGDPVRLALHLESVNDGIILTGQATATWTGECRRCLRPVTGILSADLLEVFEPHPAEGETQLLEGAHIDVEPVAREAALLGLPLAPLCRADCPGLCPTCGVDLSDGTCSCAPEVVDHRWAALDELR